MTEEAIAALRSASVIYGSARALAIARPHLPRGCTIRTIDDFKALTSLPEEAVVLSTGDPMLAGLGFLKGDIIPGISSLQVAAARLRIPLAQIVPVVAHGKGHKYGIEAVVEELMRKRIVFLLADPKFNVDALYLRIQRAGIPFTAAVCENVGYKEERIIVGSGKNLPKPTADLYSLMIGDF